MGINQGDWWNPNPEYVAYLEKECGKLSENEFQVSYYWTRYNQQYLNGGDNRWEAVIYFNEEVTRVT